MKKTVVLSAASVMLCIFMFAGCANLSEEYESDMAQVTPTATVCAMPTATATAAKPTPTAAWTPAATPTPSPAVREEVRFVADINADGQDDTIIVSSIGYDDEYEMCSAVSLEVRNKPGGKIVFTNFLQFAGAYLTQTPKGKPCVLVSGYEEDAWKTTCVCSFDGLTPVLRSTADGIVGEVDGTRLILSSYTYTIGDWDCTREYKLTDDFTLTPVSDIMIVTEGREPLITLCEVPVEMWEDGAYVPDTLPEGTSIWPVSADGEGHMTFRLRDGRTGRITYTPNDYGYPTIDGVDVNECFDNIEYWGQRKEQGQ